MSDRKVNLTRAQMLKVLKENNFIKRDVARSLGVDEASVRRACDKHNIDTDLERRSNLEDIVTTKYQVKKGNSGRKVKEGRLVVIPDLHANTVIWPVLQAVCEFIKDFQPQYLIQLGDIMDYECLLGVTKKKYPSFDGKDFASLEKEFQATAKIISMLNEAAPKGCKKYLLKGNHEYRADELIKRYPEFETLFGLEQRLDLSGWEVKPYLERLKIGKLNFIHGEFYGQSPVKKHLITYQKNVVFGHTHAISQDSMPSPMRSLPIVGYNIGCICTLNADYMRNKSSRAEHGFGYGVVDEVMGDFFFLPTRIVYGRFWARDKWYGTRKKD
jgi:UDP-2,3-diacylglucosamine pyrophosphatase LpxH